MMCGMLEGVAHWRRGDASFHDFTELIKGLLAVPSIAQGLNHLVNERKVKNVNQVINAALGNVTALARCLSQGCVWCFGVFYFGSSPLEVCEMAFVVRGVGRLLFVCHVVGESGRGSGCLVISRGLGPVCISFSPSFPQLTGQLSSS